MRGIGGGHLWVFETDRREYGRPDPELGHRDAASVTLRTVAFDSAVVDRALHVGGRIDLAMRESDSRRTLARV